MSKTRILLICMILIIIPVSSAIGVSPTSKQLFYEPGLKGDLCFKVVNNEAKDMEFSVEMMGDLSEYVTINKTEYNISAGQNHVEVDYHISVPQELDKYGPLEGEFVVIEKRNHSSQVGASSAVITKLVMNAPYPGKYLETIPPGLFVTQDGTTMKFTIPVRNLGSEDIQDIFASIAVRSSPNVVTQFDTNHISLRSKDQSKVVADLLTPLEGSFEADITLNYDGKQMTFSKPFSAGIPSVDILKVEYSQFKLNQINKILIYVKNNWNKNLNNIHAELILKDKEGNIVDSSRTASFSIDCLSEKVLEGYLTFKESGVYQLVINLYYGDQKIAELIEFDQEHKRSPWFAVAYIILFIAIANIIYIVYMIRKRNKEDRLAKKQKSKGKTAKRRVPPKKSKTFK